MYAAAFVWAKILAKLEGQLTAVTVSAWLDDAEVIRLTEDKLIIYSPSDFRRDIIRTRCAAYIEEAAAEIFDMNIRLEVVDDANIPPHQPQNPVIEPIYTRFTFDNYVEGSANRLAKQVAMMAAREPGSELCNPLFMYGPPGVGKTHLLYAAANYLQEHRPDLKVVCIKTEQFTTDLIQAIRNDSMMAFREKHRTADVLLLDDVHFLAGKEATQEEFFHTFNTLYENGKQMIITCDRNLSELSLLTDRLQHRFGSGVMVQIGAPDQQVCLQIIRRKAEKYDLQLTEDSMEYIASTVDNIRRAEGVLKKLCAYRDLTGSAVTGQLVRNTVEDLPTTHTAPQITPQTVLKQVCNYYDTDPQTVLGTQRTRNAAEPRQIAMFLIRQLTNSSLDDIAAFFSRDRATIIYSIKKTEKTLLQQNRHLNTALREIRGKIENA